MHLLTLSGSTRNGSTNTALLQCFASVCAAGTHLSQFEGLATLPIFTPDTEGTDTPQSVQDLAAQISAADGIVISCPEYVHALPGGFKNAIDWLVPRFEIIDKPIALLHASARGDDVLAELRLVLGTVSQNFNPDIFARFNLMNKTSIEIQQHMAQPQNHKALVQFRDQFCAYVATFA